MKSNEIEELLLSEMNEVHGGNARGVCECKSGAAQSANSNPDDKCECTTGAVQTTCVGTGANHGGGDQSTMCSSTPQI